MGPFIEENATMGNMTLGNMTMANVTAGVDMSAFHGSRIFRNLVYVLNMYGLAVLIIVGIVGNTLSLVVFVGTRLRQQSSSVYLAFLNVVDTLFLCCIGIIWLGWLNVGVMNKNGWCQLTVYFSYVSGFLSVWTVVCFTVERFIVVYFPLMRVVYCTRRRALVVITCLAVGCLHLYLFALITSGPHNLFGDYRCMTFPRYEPLVRILSTIDTFITLVVPSLIIILLNLLIARKLWHFRHVPTRTRNRSRSPSNIDSNNIVQYVSINGTVTLSGSTSGSRLGEPAHVPRYGNIRCGGAHRVEQQEPLSILSSPIRTNTYTPSDDTRTNQPSMPQYLRQHCCCFSTAEVDAEAGPWRMRVPISRQNTDYQLRRHIGRGTGDQMRTTRSLLVISSLFVVLNLPSHAFRVWVTVTYITDVTVVFSQSALLWQLVFQFLYYANFSVNFFMYCACSTLFRDGLRTVAAGLAARCRGDRRGLQTPRGPPRSQRSPSDVIDSHRVTNGRNSSVTIL